MSTALFDLSGRTALVTGSSRGLGRAIAEGMAKAGAKIIVNGVDPKRVEQAVAEFRAAGHQAGVQVAVRADRHEADTAHVMGEDADLEAIRQLERLLGAQADRVPAGRNRGARVGRAGLGQSGPARRQRQPGQPEHQCEDDLQQPGAAAGRRRDRGAWSLGRRVSSRGGLGRSWQA